jgi:hypothetical protein
VEEVKAVIVPTTVCLLCHDVRPSGNARLFESIPFDQLKAFIETELTKIKKQ